MSTEEILSLKTKVSNIDENVKKLEKLYSGLVLDNKSFLKANNSILPGKATKVFYDKNGLIIKGDNINEDDIPIIEIGRVKGLIELLDSKASNIELKRVKESLDNINPRIIDPGTGIKINYDAYGRVTSSADLVVNDIPELPATKIQGLVDRLNLFETSIKDKNEEKKKITNPGTFTKISFDENGLVRSGTNLTLNDIPNEIITRLNMIESKLVEFVSIPVVDVLKNEITKKLDSNYSIIPGEYTKVVVDSKGLVTGGEKLSIRDLPVLNINNIRDLDQTLRSKCSQEDHTNLYNIVAGLINKVDNNPELINMKSDIDAKAGLIEFTTLSNQFKVLERLVEDLTPKIPNEFIENTMNEFKSIINSLQGRVNILEEALVNSEFDKNKIQST